MKRINNSDINILLSPKLVNISNFTARFYTVNAQDFFIRKTQDDVTEVERPATIDDVEAIINGDSTVTDYYLKLDWVELVTLGEGVLQYQIINNIEDSGRTDNYYNTSVERTTDYYINSNIIVDPEESESYAEIIAELGENVEAISGKIDTKLDASAYTPTDLTDYYTKSEVYNKTEVDDIIAGIDVSDLSGYVQTSAFTEYSAATDTLISSKLDASAYTPTDLTNYYTKSQVYNKTEVDNIVESIDVSDQLSGYVQTSAFTAYSASVESEIEENELATSEAINDLNSRVINIVNNTYTKSQTSGATEISTALSGKLDTSAYTPTDLTNYYTKSQTSGASEISTALSGKLDTSTFNIYSGSVETALSGKQDTLSAGTNITISGNVISAEGGGKAVSGGTNISITTGETADTINCTLPIYINQYNGRGDINIGTENNANSDYYRIAIGRRINMSSLRSTGSIAIGVATNNSSDINKCYGGSNVAIGRNFQIGESDSSSGVRDNCVVVGNEAKSLINNGVAIGSETTVSGTTKTNINNQLTIDTSNQVYIYNKDNTEMICLQDQLGGGSSYTAGTGIDITNDVISVTGKVDTSDFNTYSAATDTLITSVNNKFGGLKLQQITQSDYTNLSNKDNSTLYVIVN